MMKPKTTHLISLDIANNVNNSKSNNEPDSTQFDDEKSKLGENNAIETTGNEFSSDDEEVKNVCTNENEDHGYAMKKYFQSIPKSSSREYANYRKRFLKDLETVKVGIYKIYFFAPKLIVFKQNYSFYLEIGKKSRNSFANQIS